ncbi:GFA family protein [Porphyrobacter sp. YT40]|uniref:GFA family protein n=1 Tax=Porphyrobacter sp. YT40 TaxID=2547601 RepID=UPI00257372FC|nr:GFA family protein [Porphyrobacter sp. YT40]
MTLTCLCGAVCVTTARRPEFIHACNCDMCRKAGARWGYFDPAEVEVSGPTARYQRRDKAEAGAEVHFCPDCGSTMHFRLTAAAVAKHGDVMAGVNMGLADDADLAGIELRYPDGKAWSGEGAFGFYRKPEVIGADAP